MLCDPDFLKNRLEYTKNLIEAYEAAVLALAGASGIQSYTLDTGQTRDVVTRYDLPSLQRSLDALYARYQQLCMMSHGSRAVIARSGW